MNTITLLTQLNKFRSDSKLTAQKVQELSRKGSQHYWKKRTSHASEMVEFFAPGLRQFQFEQTSPNSLALRVSVLDGYSDTRQIAEEKLNEILVKTNTESFVSAKVEIVNSIGLNPKTGKFKIIIPFSS